MRRPPPRAKRNAPRLGKAQVTHATVIREGGKGLVVSNKSATEPLDIPVPPGDESVSVGYDLKYWGSDQNCGMTIGTSSIVKLSCGPGDLDRANDVAAELAHKYMSKNAEKARRELDEFLDKR